MNCSTEDARGSNVRTDWLIWVHSKLSCWKKTQLYVGLTTSVRPTFNITRANEKVGITAMRDLSDYQRSASSTASRWDSCDWFPSLLKFKEAGKPQTHHSFFFHRHCRATGVMVVRLKHTGADWWEFIAASFSLQKVMRRSQAQPMSHRVQGCRGQKQPIVGKNKIWERPPVSTGVCVCVCVIGFTTCAVWEGVGASSSSLNVHYFWRE